jgi:germination protein YpeB
LKKWNFKINLKPTAIIVSILAITIIVSSFVYTYNLQKKYKTMAENKYNMAFYELVNDVQNMESYLAKAQISTSAKSGAENLTNVWREASIAQSNLSQLPLTSSELGNTSKLLNQISDYSYSLSRKNMNGETLSSEDMSNIKELYGYSVELESTLEQLSTDINDGKVKWGDLTQTDTIEYASQVSTISANSFANLEENLHEYSGLIYDGAFSEHLTSIEKKGLTGDDIDEEKAKEIVENYYGNDNIEKIVSTSYSDNANIPSFDFTIQLKNNDNYATISISKKGGHIIFSNYNKQVSTEIITEDDAKEIGKKFLQDHGYSNMKETYYLKENGIVTINYAYKQIAKDGTEVVMYPDLIKLRIALDDGSVLGLESSGYLNSHIERDISNILISKGQAKSVLNSDLEIESEDLAVIPTKWKTEILCWEFKGKVDENEFLVYINAQTGKEEDILLIVNTPNGTLTH